MNLRVQLNLLLPIWIVIWSTAAIVFADLAFLRADSVTGVIKSIEIQRGSKGSKICQLKLDLPQGTFSRSTDSQTCKLVFEGDKLTLEKTKILDRWVALYDNENNKLTGELLENRILTDVMFILLALFIPFLYRFKLSDNTDTLASIAFGFQLVGVVYFWFLFT
jgi:hypothetical protein